MRVANGPIENNFEKSKSSGLAFLECVLGTGCVSRAKTNNLFSHTLMDAIMVTDFLLLSFYTVHLRLYPQKDHLQTVIRILILGSLYED